MCRRTRRREAQRRSRTAGAHQGTRGVEETGGAATRRRSFWLAVSGSGRRVAFHEAAGSRHLRLRESAVFCVHPPRVYRQASPGLPTEGRGGTVVKETFFFDIEEVEKRGEEAINLLLPRVCSIDKRRWCATPRVPSARRKWTRT